MKEYQLTIEEFILYRESFNIVDFWQMVAKRVNCIWFSVGNIKAIPNLQNPTSITFEAYPLPNNIKIKSFKRLSNIRLRELRKLRNKGKY